MDSTRYDPLDHAHIVPNLRNREALRAAQLRIARDAKAQARVARGERPNRIVVMARRVGVGVGVIMNAIGKRIGPASAPSTEAPLDGR